MACSTVGYSYGAVDQVEKKQLVTLNGTFTNEDTQPGISAQCYYQGFRIWLTGQEQTLFERPYDTVTGYTGEFFAPDSQFNYSLTPDGNTYGHSFTGDKPSCDTTYNFRAFEYYGDTPDDRRGPKAGSILSFKAYAIDVTFGTPSATNPGIYSVDVSCQWYPNTVESTASAIFQYKRNSDSTWVNSSVVQNAQSGYAVKTISGTISGLESSTLYNFRVYVSRTTSNTTTYTSGTVSNTTLAANPTVSTVAASGVDHQSATLNGHVNSNGFSTYYFFRWGTDPTLATYTETAWGGPTTGATDFSQSLTNLASSTTYYFKARAYGNGVYVEGSIGSFVTSAPPPYPNVTTGGYSLLTDHSVLGVGYVNPNGLSTTYYFQAGLTTAYGVTTPEQGPSSATAPFAFFYYIDTLNPNTTYHFRAVAKHNGVEYYGADIQFTTLLTDEQYAAKEDHMHIYEYDGQYGVQKTVYFSLQQPAATTSDRLVTTVPGTLFVAGDLLIYKDGVLKAMIEV